MFYFYHISLFKSHIRHFVGFVSMPTLIGEVWLHFIHKFCLWFIYGLSSASWYLMLANSMDGISDDFVCPFFQGELVKVFANEHRKISCGKLNWIYAASSSNWLKLVKLRMPHFASCFLFTLVFVCWRRLLHHFAHQ